MRARWALTAVLTLVAAAGLAATAAALVVAGGLYDVSATTPHTQPVFSLMEQTLRHAVRRRASSITTPVLDTPALLQRGALCFRDHCTVCHGAPGVAPAPFALSMQPVPGPLNDAAARWRPRELYWITRHGIRMSGMPAWGHQLADSDLWAVAAFVAQMPGVSPAAWASTRGSLQSQQCAVLQ